MATTKATTDGLNIPITTRPTDDKSKQALIEGLWGPDPTRDPQSKGYNILPYLDYYYQQCDIFCLEQSTYSTLGVDAITTHQDIINLAQKLKASQSTRDEIANNFLDLQPSDPCHRPPPTDAIHNAIDWAARLVTMMEVGQPRCAFSPQRPLIWAKAELADFVADQFKPARVDKGDVRLQKIFTARNIELLARITIVWTSNLADHLSLKDDDTKLSIFHHATFLRNKADVFPPGFCEETLRTLALLLPSSNKDTVAWYRKQQSVACLDVNAIKCPRLRADDRQIDNFHFWKERLVILKQNFDEAEPSTISQWWYDRRKGPQWYTFWVAIAVLLLTVFFGVVQSIEGALQVYKAYNPD